MMIVMIQILGLFNYCCEDVLLLLGTRSRQKHL